MIIDKVLPYWTDEDRLKLGEIHKTQDELMDSLHDHGEEEVPRALKKWGELDDEANQIYEEVEARYSKSRGKKGIIADAEDIVAHIEKTDFQGYVARQIEILADMKNRGAKEESLSPLRKYAAENYENCYLYILLALRVQLNAVANDEPSTNKIIAIVEKRAGLWYVKTQPAYIPMAHGRATDAFAYMNTRNARIDRITGNAVIDKRGVQLAIQKLQELHATLGISTDKLLSTAIARFTQQNDFRHTKTQPPKREISIPLKEYAQQLGYDVEEHATSTPEEAEKEKKRAKNQLDNARKAIRQDLDILHASTLTWEEPIKGKTRDFARVSLVTFTGIKSGEIKISLSPELAGYLAERNIVTQYPTKLLRISGRQPTAYYLGRKLAEHYNMDNNQIRGTHDRISIPSLLAVTDLPSYEEVMKQDRHWDRRIKEPLEQALDTLTKEGVLKTWKYTHAKGIDLTEEEAYNITSYDEFSKLYLRFTLAEAVDHTERIQTKQEARKETRKKSTSKKNS